MKLKSISHNNVKTVCECTRGLFANKFSFKGYCRFEKQHPVCPRKQQGVLQMWS